MLEGFVTLGRAELLFSFCAVAVLMAALGWALGQIVMISRKSAAPAPKPCARLHCDDDKQRAQWLRDRDYNLITNEVLAEMEADLARYRNRPTEFKPFDGVLQQAVSDAFRRTGKHRKPEESEL